MQEIVTVVGCFFLLSTGLGLLVAVVAALVGLFLRRRSPRILGAELPVMDARIDLSKRYDIVYGAGFPAAHEKLVGVRILGYLRSDRDETTREYMDSRWLVVELPDGRRAYLRPKSVLWLLEAAPT